MRLPRRRWEIYGYDPSNGWEADSQSQLRFWTETGAVGEAARRNNWCVALRFKHRWGVRLRSF